MASAPPAEVRRRRKRNQKALNYDWLLSPDGVGRIIGFILPYVNKEAAAQGALVSFSLGQREIYPHEAYPGALEESLRRADPRSLLYSCLSRWLPFIRASQGDGLPSDSAMMLARNNEIEKADKVENDTRRSKPKQARAKRKWDRYDGRGNYRADVEDATAKLDSHIRAGTFGADFGDHLANAPHRWSGGMYVPVINGHLIIANGRTAAQIERDDKISDIEITETPQRGR